MKRYYFVFVFCALVIAGLVFYFRSIEQTNHQNILSTIADQVVNNNVVEVDNNIPGPQLVNPPAKLAANQIANLTYKDIASNGDKYIGQKVVWRGVVATDLTQLNGIKFRIIDEDHPVGIIQNEYDWFWAIDNATVQLPVEAGGRWVTYLVKKFTGTDDSYSEYIYEVNGIVEYNDCTYYDKVIFGKEVCIPNVSITSLKMVGLIPDVE